MRQPKLSHENANSDCCYTKPYKWDMASHTIGGICDFTVKIVCGKKV